jgi:hypothetical protein
MNDRIIVTNLYPAHMHYESVRMSFESAGYRFVSLVDHRDARPTYDGPAVAQFIFNYPMSEALVEVILSREAAGQPYIVMMDDPLAFFDLNINGLIVPVLKQAARVYTSTDNMLPIYAAIGVQASLLVGLANPLFDCPEPVNESEMRYDWGFIGGLYPQRFRFFWQLERLLPDLTRSIVTSGFDHQAVIRRIRETKVNIAYGNFSDIPDFRSNGTTLRAWEFPYAGAFILHDDRPLLANFFADGKSIVTFRKVEECAELIRHYVARPIERQRIAQKAREIIDKRRMLDFFPQVYQELLDHDH